MDDILAVRERWAKEYIHGGGDPLIKALQAQGIEPKSAIIDPYNLNGMNAATRSKPTAVPYSTLRRMSRVPAVAAIIQTRLNQVARFARRPRYDGDMGFEIVLKDKNRPMTQAAAKRAWEIEEFFMKTGSIPNLKRKDNFNQFLRKITRDTLTLDVMTWENVGNLKGKIAEMWAVDGATIELVANAPVSDSFQLPVYVPQTKRGLSIDGEIAYIQRINGQIVAEYTEDELAFAIRNPRTDLEFTDFGMSELEMLMEIVTGILNGVRYNTSYFNHSSLPQGILEIVGRYKDEHLTGFKRHWKQLTQGAAGKWSVPVMALEEGQGLKFTNFKNSNKDMEFNQFLEFLFNVACAVYQIDPNEVGFKSWTSGSSRLSQSDNTQAKMEESKDKGFVPLMNFLSDTFNSEVVDYIDPDFEFNWVGVDEQDEDKKLDRQDKQLSTGVKTVRMIWKENDVDVDQIAKDYYGGQLPKWVDAPANPQLIQVYMAEAGLNQPQQGEDPNAEDPNAEMEQQQAVADDQHEKGKEMADDSHEKEIEKMDKEHEQTIELEKLKHKHTLEQKKLDAKAKPQEKKPMNKSLTSEDDEVEVVISWNDY